MQTKSAWKGNNHFKKKKILQMVQSSVSMRIRSDLSQTCITWASWCKHTVVSFTLAKINSFAPKLLKSVKHASVNHAGHKTLWRREGWLGSYKCESFSASFSLKEYSQAYVVGKDKISRALSYNSGRSVNWDVSSG